MKINYKQQFFIAFGIVLILFIIGSTTTEYRGTGDHWVYWPIVSIILAFILWFGGNALWSYISQKINRKK